MGHGSSPNEQSEERRWNNDTLDEKQDAQFSNRHESQNRLNDPVEEEAQYSSS
jgi:hypothetical protein